MRCRWTRQRTLRIPDTAGYDAPRTDMSRAASGSLRRGGERLTLVDVEPGVCALGSWQNVIAVIWWSTATGSAVERLERVMLGLREKYPQGVSQIHLVKDRAGTPASDARVGIVRLMNDYAADIANCAVVVGGSGFWASTMRSAITSMRFLSPRSFEMRLHRASSEVLEWLPEFHKKRTNIELVPEDLGRILNDAEEWLLGGFESAQVAR